ncbi:MAG: hypothetical protein J6I50_08735 [Clostridia bacterium]|nr:hypothetical protein [Clostridia bacterium]
MIDTKLRGIDVSVYQGSIDWKKTANAGIRFAMLKATQGRSVKNSSLYLFEDSTFKKNAENANANGIICGAYHYLTATTQAQAIEEAEYFLSVIKPYKAKLPLGAAVDVEDSRLPKNKELLTQIVQTFCDTVKKAGFEPLIYTNPDYLTHRLGDVTAYGLWLALWRDKKYVPRDQSYPNLRMWQWGTEKVDGISAQTDANFGAANLLSAIQAKNARFYETQVCRIAGLSNTAQAYLKAYPQSEALFQKLYDAITNVNKNSVSFEP